MGGWELALTGLGVVLFSSVLYAFAWVRGIRYAVMHPRKIVEAMNEVQVSEFRRQLRRGVPDAD